MSSMTPLTTPVGNVSKEQDVDHLHSFTLVGVLKKKKKLRRSRDTGRTFPFVIDKLTELSSVQTEWVCSIHTPTTTGADTHLNRTEDGIQAASSGTCTVPVRSAGVPVRARATGRRTESESWERERRSRVTDTTKQAPSFLCKHIWAAFIQISVKMLNAFWFFKSYLFCMNMILLYFYVCVSDKYLIN